MALTDYQALLNGLTMGRSTNYPGVGGTKGAIGLPRVREHDVEFELRHGAQAGVDVYGQRIIQIPIQVIADDEDTLATRLNTLQAAWQPSSTDVELALKFAGTELSYFGRPRGLSDDAIGTKGLIGGHAFMVGTFVAADPFAYGAEVTTATDTSSPIVVTNAGNAVSRRCSLIVVGNGGMPTLTNTDDPHLGDVTFAATLSGAETCELDLAAQTAFVGGTDIIQRVNIASLWTDLQPGDNTITFSGCASVTAFHRPAFQGN